MLNLLPTTDLNPTPAWRQSCTQQGLFWRMRCLRESIFDFSLDQTLWRRGRKAQSVSHSPSSLPPRLANATKHNHICVFNAALAMLDCPEILRMQIFNVDNTQGLSSPACVLCTKYKHCASLHMFFYYCYFQ